MQIYRYSFIKNRKKKYKIYGLDKFTNNYDIKLKYERLKKPKKYLLKKM